MFSQFQDYDDEGYLLMTVQQFVRGLPLYDEVYTQYGPAYYLWQQVLHTLLQIPVTHDATRLVTVVVWLVCAALVGTMVWLLTKRLLFTAIGAVAAFLHLTQLTYEPGHPQELVLLGVLGAIVLTTWRLVVSGRLGVVASVVVGVLLSMTALTKMNVGAFLAGALALGLVTSLRPSRWRTALTRILVAAAMVGVLALMRDDLGRSDIAACVVVVCCGLLAAVIARTHDTADEGIVTARDFIAGMFGFAIGSVAIVAAIVYRGTSPRALFDGLFVAPLLLPKVFWRPLPVPLLVAAIAPASLWAAWYSQRARVARQRWMLVIALVCGLAMFVLSITKRHPMLFAVGPLLAWVVLASGPARTEQRAARGILAFAAILIALQAYPMPEGTQIVLGTLLFVPLALATIPSAEPTLAMQQRVPATQSSFGRRAIFAALVIAAAVNIGGQAQRFYARAVPLGMPGAQAVRTTARVAATYQWLRANLRENCDAFLTAPGLNSMHFWTNIAPISPLNTTLWPLLFDADQQRRILAAAAPIERLCVVWAPKRMAVLTSAPDLASRPLIAWLQQEFETRGRVGEWELRTRRENTPTLVYGARWVNGGISVELPSIGYETVARMAVVDVNKERTLGDSARGAEVVVLDEDGARLNVDAGIDISRRRNLMVRLADVETSSLTDQSVAVRFWARDGRSLAIVPIVIETPGEGLSVTNRPQP